MTVKSRHTGRLRAPAVLSTTGNAREFAKQDYIGLSVLADNTKPEIVETCVLVILTALGTAQ